MQKNTSHILIVATVIAMLPLQSFALETRTGATNSWSTYSSQETERNDTKDRFKRFSNDAERQDFIQGKLREVRKKNLGASFVEKDTTVRARKVRTLVDSFHDGKKNRKEIIVTATGGLDTIQSSLSNVDDSTTVKSIGNNLYSVTFQDGKNLDANYFQDLGSGNIPEKLFDFPIIEPVLMTSDATIDPSLAGEAVSNLWGMTKMEATNYESGLSRQPNPVAIAIIDTGIDRAHKDLSKNTWVNTKEIPGNGIDDDGNGYMDDVNGYDFVNKDSDPMDDHGHGTHVSGSAAGVMNGAWVFGVNSSAKVAGLKVLSAAGNGSSYDVYKAIYYAADNGLKVINMSLGGGGTPSNDPICAAIDYAKSKGTITVVAGGNSNVDVSTQVPAGCANAITVGAVDSTLTKASFSNYGAKTDVAAPGVGVYSSLPGNTYGTWAGTSMATPYIAGLVSALKTYKPALTVDDIKTILKNTALTEPVTSSVNIGRFPNMTKIFTSLGIKSDSELGSGTSAPVPTPPPVTDTTPPQTSTLSVALTTQTGTTLSVSINEAGTGYYLVFPGTASAPSVSTIIAGNNILSLKANTVLQAKIGGLTPNTVYKLWFVAKDLVGNTQTRASSVAFTTLTVSTPDTVAPTTPIAPSVSLTTQTGTTLSVGISEDGTGYYLVQLANMSMPGTSTIIAGNKTIALKANISGSVKIDGLTANTSYKIWFVAKDLAGNTQTTISVVSFTTLAATKGNVPPTLAYSAKLVSKNTYELTIIGKDTDGTISRYAMYMNGGILFTTLPKVTVRISGGNVTVYAKVYDNLGASATSPNITLQYTR